MHERNNDRDRPLVSLLEAKILLLVPEDVIRHIWEEPPSNSEY